MTWNMNAGEGRSNGRSFEDEKTQVKRFLASYPTAFVEKMSDKEVARLCRTSIEIVYAVRRGYSPLTMFQ